MVSFELLITFFITTLIFAYIPGPAMLYTAAQTISKGKKSGLMAALGIFIGGCFHILISAAGLAALFHVFPFLYSIIKILGACWLVWLGLKLIVTKPVNKINLNQDIETKTLKESILVEVLNPKTAIFYLAFLPQFINIESGFPVWLQFIILGLVVNISFVSADIVCVFLAEFVLKKVEKSNKSQRTMSIIGGIIFISLGIFVALSKH
jgi:threonine/homoserine/homoserine lactone efflux protein